MTINPAQPAPKSGRPRRYAFGPLPDFKNAEAAQLAATVDEMTERVFDLIADKAVRSCDAAYGGIGIWRGHRHGGAECARFR